MGNKKTVEIGLENEAEVIISDQGKTIEVGEKDRTRRAN
jgi:hypothetical protein